jgi:hypothetical protein
VGDDGHRGWLYYVAVDEGHRRSGLGEELVPSAEGRLRERGQTRVRLMVRNENEDVRGFYAHLGYADQDCAVLGRGLDEELPGASSDTLRDGDRLPTTMLRGSGADCRSGVRGGT